MIKIGKYLIRLGSISVLVTLFIMLFCLMAYGVMLLSPVQNYVRGVIEKKLDSFVDGNVKIGRIRSNLLSRTDIYDVSILDKNGRDDSISLGHLRVRYNLLAVLNRKVHITSVFCENIYAALSVTSEKVYSIPVIPARSSKASKKNRKSDKTQSSGWNVVIGNVRLKNLNAAYRDSCLNFYGSVYRANIRARFPQIDSILLDLRVPQASYDSRWWNGDLDTIGVKEVLKFNSLQILDCYVKGSGSEVRGKGIIPFRKSGIWDLEAQISTLMAPVSAIHGYVPAVLPQGNLRADVSWKGTLKEPVLKINTTGSGLKYGYIDVDSMAFKADYKNGSWASSKGMVLSSLGKATVNVKLQIPDLMSKPSFLYYQGNFRIDQAKLSLIKEKLKIAKKNIPGESAIVEGFLKGNGFKKLPQQLQLRANIEDKNIGSDTLRIVAELLNKQWVVDGRLGGAFVEGNGRIQPNGALHGEINGQIGDVKPVCRYFIKQNISGKLKFEATVDGDIKNPYIQFSLNSRNLKWKSIRMDTLDASASYDDKGLVIKNGFSRFSANIDTIADFFKVDSTGGLVGVTLQTSGPLSSLDIGCKIAGSGMFYKNYRADSINTSISANNFKKISWENGYIRSDNTEVKTRGMIDLALKHTDAHLVFQTVKSGKKKDAGDIRVSGLIGADSVRAGFKVSQFFFSSLSPWIDINKHFSGSINAEGNFTGNYRDLQGKVSARLSKPGFKMYRLALVDCRLALVDSLMSIDSEIYLKDTSSVLHFNASLPLLPSMGWAFDTVGFRDARATLTGNDIDLSVVASILDSGSQAKGMGSVNLNLFNNHGQWDIGGNLKIDNGYYVGRNHDLSINNIKFLSTFAGSVFDPDMEYAFSTGEVVINESKIDSLFVLGESTIDTFWVKKGKFWFINNGTVDISAKLPLHNIDSLLIRPGFETDFTINRFPLVIASPFIAENMIRSGEVNGSGKIQITKGRPVLSGDIGIENARFALEDIEPVIGPLSAKIVLQQDSLLLQQLNVKCGKGKIKGDGFITWNSAGLNEMKINVKSKDLYLDLRDLASIRIQNGNLMFSNKRDGGYLISGGIELGDTRVVRDLRIVDLVEQLQKSDMNIETDPFLQKLSLKVEVKLLDNLAVDINLGDLKAGGEISITGTAAKPTYTGQIRIVEGFIYYFDRKFEITNGSFYNYDPYELNPLIDLEAVTEVDAISSTSNGALQTIESYTIYLSVKGNLSKPEVRIWSEGVSLDEGNIISILTFGQPLGAVGGDIGSRLRAFAQQSIVGFGARKLEQVLGIERIDLKGNIFNFDSEDSPTLSLTKRFSPRFLLSYETDLGDLTKPKVTAMFRMTKHFFMEGQTDVDNYGLDLLFKFSR